jgi:hypothetical protein
VNKKSGYLLMRLLNRKRVSINILGDKLGLISIISIYP